MPFGVQGCFFCFCCTKKAIEFIIFIIMLAALDHHIVQPDGGKHKVMRDNVMHLPTFFFITKYTCKLPAVYISIWKAFWPLEIKKNISLVTQSEMYSPTLTEHNLCMCLNSGFQEWGPSSLTSKHLLYAVTQWKYVPSLKSRQVACSLFCLVSVGIWLSAGTVELSSKFASDHTGHFNRGGVLYSPVPDNWRQ